MKKNIVFILPDQLRPDYLGCYGASFAHTPNIDKLAKEGIKFDSCISPSPLCVPARASLLTGLSAIENGVLNNLAWLRPDYKSCGIETWPSILSNNGYSTTAIGKMHFYPWDENEGFQSRIICEDKRHILIRDDYADYLEKKGLRKFHGNEVEGYRENGGAVINPLPYEDQADTWITDQSIKFIEEVERSKPFALMVGLLSPHCPYDPDKRFADLFENAEMPKAIENTKESNTFRDKVIKQYIRAWSDIDFTTFTEDEKDMMRRYYCACVTHVDECVGKIVKTLKEQGLYDNTVIIFASDHGDFLGDYDLVGKCFFYESSIKVPLIIRDPELFSKNIKDESRNNLVSLTDVRSLILDIAGIENFETDSSKALPLLADNNNERYVFGATDQGYMVRGERYKLARYLNGTVTLFDLKTDKQERVNLISDTNFSNIREELDRVLQSEILRSMYSANNDKKVDFNSDLNPSDFFGRNWDRPYPNNSN
jgi:arylsulfatase A-like enzyme